VPAGLIGRLAIDQRFQPRGLGSLLVVDAAGRAMRAAPVIYALLVDAKSEDAAAFYVRLGVSASSQSADAPLFKAPAQDRAQGSSTRLALVRQLTPNSSATSSL